MNEQDLSILTRFLTQLDPEVEGRAAEPPPAEIAELLNRFASGAASPTERSKVAGLLKEHPEWVRYLAQAIRQRG